MKRLNRNIRYSIFFILCFCACAETALAQDIDASYFHPAASYYIHGDSTSASNLVAKGLSLFPEDEKLLRLKDLLDQEQEKEQEQDQENQNQDQQQDNQDKDKDQQQDPKDPQDKQNKDQQQDESQQEQQQQSEPPRAEQMSQDEAEQLLDAMKQEEKNKRLQLHPVMGAPVKVDKDW